MAYYTLVTRENKTSPWFIQFGDYDRETAIEEMQISYWTRNRDPNCKIIKTKTARQSEITKAVAELNSKVEVVEVVQKATINDRSVELSEGMTVIDDGQWQFIQYKGFDIHTMEEGGFIIMSEADDLSMEETKTLKAAKKLIDKAVK